MKHEFNTRVYKDKTYSGLLAVFAKQGTFRHISVLGKYYLLSSGIVSFFQNFHNFFHNPEF